MTDNVVPIPADLLIHSARLWSDGSHLPHSVLVAAKGTIVALGNDELRARYAAERVIDAKGGLVTPSFVDAHVHMAQGGIEQLRCDLTECESAEEVYAEIAAYAKATPDAEWILGGGWRMPFFPGGTPLREDLDRIVPDRPAFLLNADHHGAWANSLALEAAGITADTPDPVDGRIERDAAGNPTGTLHEGAADLLGAVLPDISEDEIRAGQLAGEVTLFSFGITGWQEAVLGDFLGYPDFTSTFRTLIDEGKLRGNVTGALWVSRDFEGMTIPDFVADLERRRALYGGRGLTIDTAKIMVDGVAENETAAMEEPYLRPCTCGESGGVKGAKGLAYFSREELLELVPLLNARGFNAHFHTIGDRAARYALDAVEAVPSETRATVRNHIAHLQVINPADVPRFAPLGVTANMQALWASYDAQMLDLTVPIMGDERMQWQYLFRSLHEAGTQLACGSDWPVSTPDPWQAMHVAVNRRGAGITDLPPLLPAEALNLETILTAYTRGSHELIGVPGGVLTVGETCDLAIADRDPFAGDAVAIHLTTNVATVLRGEVVYEAH
ncbi:MAG: amidohydrolase [Leucobacter sp.]